MCVTASVGEHARPSRGILALVAVSKRTRAKEIMLSQLLYTKLPHYTAIFWFFLEVGEL